MRKSVVLAFLFIVTVPMGLACWLGWRSIRTEQERFQARVQELQRERLQEFADNQMRWINTVETSLVQLLENLRREPLENWPEITSRSRFARAAFSIAPEGMIAWPDESVLPLTAEETRLRELIRSGQIDFMASGAEGSPGGNYFNWSTWFEGPGQQWAFWIRNDTGGITGLLVDRTAFISEAIAQLPSGTESSYSRSRPDAFLLLNEAGEMLYGWGGDAGNLADSDVVETTLPSPLNMWHVRLVTAAGSTPPWYRQPLAMAMGAGIFTIAMLTLGAAGFLILEARREFRQARMRVSFVNQVSHEFKTPLTNILLYSELLEEEVGEGGGSRYLRIIREESGKLSRMIQNVLTFARKQRAALKVNPRTMEPDRQIREQVELQRPGLERHGITLDLDLQAPATMQLDPEILSQVLGNLLSNAEKYAAHAPVSIQSRQDGDCLSVRVRDGGPGIARSRQSSVFEPFVRLEDRTSEGVSGTGIGLSIARDLARLHGGDLVLQASTEGACFEFKLREIS